MKVYFSLGSNIGDRAKLLEQALTLLNKKKSKNKTIKQQ